MSTAIETETLTVGLRPPQQVMCLERMGAFHQTRLSFMRALLRRLRRERWSFERELWQIDDRGVGVAVYAAVGPRHRYSLVCFSHDLPDSERSDRVIAERWDATFALFDGTPEPADIERLAGNVPRQEAGRCTGSELVLSRANKSVRLFEHVVDSLARGVQPEAEQIESVGYLMRTTAVYGNGKFGVSDRDRLAVRPELTGPFRAELLSVWLTRTFTVDLAEHLAKVRAPGSAVSLDRDLRRALGVGNATGLGMAPFLMTHQALIHNWMMARETALARVRSLPAALAGSGAAFERALERASAQVDGWRTVDDRQTERIATLRHDLAALTLEFEQLDLQAPMPWDALYRWGETALSLEGQEMLVSLLIEPHGELVDELADRMSIDENRYFRIDGSMSIGELRALIERDYAWALALDYTDPAATRHFWYVSEEKLEPRLGERSVEPGAGLEQPYAAGRDVSRLHEALDGCDPQVTLAEFLITHPQYRHTVRRVHNTARLPYAEIRDNLVGAALIPIDLLRCKLSFFGATRFDPRSDRWVRITMYKNAPFPDELQALPEDDWAFPPIPDTRH